MTELFQKARFSPHQIDESMRREALVALEEVRAEMMGSCRLMWQMRIELILLSIVTVVLALTFPDWVELIVWAWALLVFLYAGNAALRRVRSLSDPWKSPFEEAMRVNTSPGETRRPTTPRANLGSAHLRAPRVRRQGAPMLRELIEHRRARRSSELSPLLTLLPGRNPRMRSSREHPGSGHRVCARRAPPKGHDDDPRTNGRTQHPTPLDEIERVIVGKRDVLELILIGILAALGTPPRRLPR